jgi:hypothetical protein
LAAGPLNPTALAYSTRATSVADSDAFGRPHRSVLPLGAMSEPQNASGFPAMGVALALVLAVLVGLLIAVTKANFGPISRHSRINAMVNNLRQLDGAVQTWALEHQQTGAVLVTEADLTNYLRGAPHRIAGERYVLLPLPQSPQVVLTREVEGRPKGTVICFTTNGEVRFTPPNQKD